MATPKRKYSFGLISRLGLIGAFVGLGSWAVFNSKFKDPDPEQVAQTESTESTEGDVTEDDSLSKDGKEAKQENAKPSQAQPATFIEDTKPSKTDEKMKGPDKTGFDANKSKPKESGPPASKSFDSSFNPSKNTSRNSKAEFAKPGSSFSPTKSASPKTTTDKTKPNKKKTPGEQNKKDQKKKESDGPPSSTFNPTGGKSTKKSNDKSGPPASSFSLDNDQDSKVAGNKAPSSFSPGANPLPGSNSSFGKSTDPPPKASDNGALTKGSLSRGSLNTDTSSDGNPGLSGGSFGSSKSESGAPPSTFNPSSPSGLAGKNSSRPGTGFDPRGSFQSPGKAKSDSTDSGSKSSTGFASSSSGAPPTSNGGFQTKSSSGNERSLRGNSLTDNQGSSLSNGNPATSSGGSSGAPSSSGFSLSNSGSSPSVNGSPSNPSNSVPGTRPGNFNPTAGDSTRTNPSFATGNAFQDKGSKPLRRNDPPKSNGLVQSKGSTGVGRSSTGFANIGSPDSTQGKSADSNATPSRPGLDLNPRSFNSKNLNSGPGRSDNSPTIGGDGSRRDPPRSTAGFASQPSASGSATRFSSNPNLQSQPLSGANDRKPGPSSLEGVQAPAVTLQKLSPREIQVNVEATFQLVLRNVGRAPATNITVVDPVPEGTEFVAADPTPSERGTDGSLIWKIGSLAPNQQKIISIRLLPKQQGEIGSVARMSFQAAASAKAICTKPEVEVIHQGPQKILMGQQATFLVTIQNNGDGVAKNVVIEDEIPVGFTFGNRKGKKLAYEIGNLPPGSRREVRLNLVAVEPGKYVNEVRAKIGKTTAANHKLGVEVVAPKLSMDIVGPTRRYYQREAKYKVEVQNNGTAPAQNVLMVTRLPQGLKFLRTNNQGQYNPREHAVYWSMVALSPQNKGSVELVLLPIGTGQQEIEFEARSLLDRTELKKFPVAVDQLAELFFEVDDRDDPIEVNGETEYRIRVVNQGSKAATNININVEMPGEIQAIKTEGPSKGTVNGQQVSFAPIASLAPRGQLIYKIKAKGIRDGEHLIKVLLSSNERKEAVAKQESTKVYSEYR